MSLNDPQWGRGNSQNEEDEKKASQENRQDEKRADDRTEDRQGDNDADRPQDRNDARRRNNGGDDLDRLWEEFNRALGGMLGGSRQGGNARRQPEEDERPRYEERNDRPSDNGSGNDGNDFRKSFEAFKKMQPPRFNAPKAGRKGLTLALIVALGLWGATGFYIVPEGQSGIVTTFGKYTETTMPGFRWHMPWPVQMAEIVDVSSVRTVAIGAAGRANREAEALMLTDDENIVDLRFNVQYRIKSGDGAMNYLFRSRDPDESVRQSAESAMREVVGRRKMDSVLFESKQEIAEGVKRIMQEMLDRYRTGIEIMSVAIQNAQPPEPVQAAFNDAVKAGQDRERQINEGEAYANAVIPKAHGAAARLALEAEGYKARVIESAAGDAERFKQILAEYEKAPQVTRERMYVDMMQQVMRSTTKVYVDTRDGNNLLYLPFDKLMEQNKLQGEAAAQEALTSSAVAGTETAPQPASSQTSTTTRAASTAADDLRSLRYRGR